MTDETAALAGKTIGITADRRWEEQAELFRRRGALVMHGATVRTRDVAADDGLTAATEALIEHPPEVVVAVTGAGIRKWLAAAVEAGAADRLADALKKAYVIPRGPKASMALRDAGINAAWRPPNERLDEILEHLLANGVAGKRVALQLHGADMPDVMKQLTDAGADVVEVPVYRWDLPDDIAPALDLVDATVNHRVDAVTFTAAPAVHNFFALAERAGSATGLRDALRGPVVAACIGPVCGEALHEEGIDRPLQPERSRLSFLARALTDALTAPRPR